MKLQSLKKENSLMVQQHHRYSCYYSTIFTSPSANNNIVKYSDLCKISKNEILLVASHLNKCCFFYQKKLFVK